MEDSSIPPLPTDRPLNVIIVGGSLSGLFLALTLKRNGHNVTLLEQAPHDLEHQAAGVGAGPAFTTILTRFDRSTRPLSLPADGVYDVNQRDEVLSITPVVMRMNSWDAIYYRLRWNFDGGRSEYYPEEPIETEDDGKGLYLQGKKATWMEVGRDGVVTVRYSDVKSGEESLAQADLLVGADGPNSTVRRLALEMAGMRGDVKRQYAGYVLYRGVVDENLVSDKTKAFFESHIRSLWVKSLRQYIVAYTIPGPNGSIAPGQRCFNFGWYDHADGPFLQQLLQDNTGHTHRFSVPRGRFNMSLWSSNIRRYSPFLSPAFNELVSAVRDPFLQVITGCASPRAAYCNGRVLLVGDALRLLRPHSGKGIQSAGEHVLLLERYVNGEIGWREWEERCMDLSWVNAEESVAWGHWYLSPWWKWLGKVIWYRSVRRWIELRRWWTGHWGEEKRRST